MKRYYIQKISSKLLLYFIMVSFIPICGIGILSYLISIKSLKDKVNEIAQSSLSLTLHNIDQRIENIDLFLDHLWKNEILIRNLRDTNFHKINPEQLKAQAIIDGLLSQYLMFENGIDAALFISENRGNYYYNQDSYSLMGNLKEMELIDIIQSGFGKVVWAGESRDLIRQHPQKPTCIAGRVFRDVCYLEDLKVIGIFIFFLSEHFFQDILTTDNSNMFNSYVFNDKGKIVASAGSQDNRIQQVYRDISLNVIRGEDTIILDNEKCMVLIETSQLSGWSLAQVIPYEFYTRDIQPIVYSTLFLLLIAFAAVIGVSLFISRRMSKPILELSEAMTLFCKQDFTVSVNVNAHDEIGIISSGFNTMVEQIRDLFAETIKNEQEKREMELTALQYKINPHFIYNTLSAIRVTALFHNDKKVAEMLRILSRLLRSTVQKTGTLVPISQEIINTKDYVKILGFRYNDKLKVRYNFKPPIRQYLTPNLMLQPLIENAVIHGLNNQLNNEKCDPLLEISGKENDTTIRFSIYDNGTGMSPSKIKQLLNKSKQESVESNELSVNNSKNHIGISNIHQRIQYEFGNQYGLEIESEPGSWTMVHITIPKITGQEQIC